MSVTGLMKQTMTFFPVSSYSAQGREVLGASVSVICRFQQTNRNVTGPNGQLLTIVGVVDVPANTAVEINAKGIFNGITYRVHSKYSIIDGQGNVSHIKLELVKWAI